jgi:hypothetical protein
MEESSRDGVGSRNESGQILVFVAILLAAVIGLSAFVIDLGYAYYAQRTLQASADAAALAGAQQLPDPTAAVATAQQFGTGAGAKNASAKLGSVSEVISTRCLVSVPGCNPVNAVSVQETGHVSTFFVRFFGINTLNVHVRSTACSPCGVKPLDIMLVLDRTGSMCQDSSGKNDPTCFDLNNAKAGIKTFLNFFDPSIDWIGLAVLPPASSLASKCNAGSSSSYNSTSSPYVISSRTALRTPGRASTRRRRRIARSPATRARAPPARRRARGRSSTRSATPSPTTPTTPAAASRRAARWRSRRSRSGRRCRGWRARLATSTTSRRLAS